MINKLGSQCFQSFTFNRCFGNSLGAKKYAAHSLKSCLPRQSNAQRNLMAFVKDPIGYTVGRKIGTLCQGRVKVPNSLGKILSRIPVMQGFLSGLQGKQTSAKNNTSDQFAQQNVSNFPCLAPAAKDNARTLEAGINDKGKLAVSTADGYQISCSDSKQEWFITSPDGKSTRIWGDPHVVESDGDKWDFKEQSSFIFGDNKVTVKTTPANNGTDATLTSEITVYNGNDRVTISGINTGNPTIIGMGHDGLLHDATTADGNRYYLAKEANGDDAWIR